MSTCKVSLTSGFQFRYSCLFLQGYIVDIDFEEMSWSCTTNTGKCPGGRLSFGCPERLCAYSTNTLGTCGCENQLFIGNGCTEGFLCTSSIPNPLIYDGCIKQCQDGQILVPDFANDDWTCIEDSDDVFCPGSYHMECPENEIVIDEDFDGSNCDCDGQMWIDKTCRNAFFCFSRLGPNGGRYFTCPEGEIIKLDHQRQRVECEKDVGQCPSGGGFKLGCQLDSPTPEPLQCEWAKNDIGQCECNHEVFISDDCTKSFYCVDFPPAGEEDADGCLLDCEAEQGDKVVHLDATTNTWECVDRSATFTCPGAFNLDCENTFDVLCGCQNEIWVNGKCDKAFKCDGPHTLGVNDGSIISCPEGTRIDINWDNNPFDIRCTRDAEACPGSFHYGCGIDMATSTPETPPTPPPTTPQPPPSTTDSASVASQSIIVILLVFSVNLCLL